MELDITYLDGDAPLQALGRINGYPFYFRARNNRWEFAVANQCGKYYDHAVLATVGKGFGLVISRKYPDATSMSAESAMAIIRRCAEAFVAFSA